MNRTRRFTLTIASHIVLCAVAGSAAAQSPVWEEHFDGAAIDTTVWRFDLGSGCAIDLCGWGNRELQAYTSRPRNARVENGQLVIEAQREDHDDRHFTSARLSTEGRMQFRYGTLEARIRTPDVGNGLWPAFWTLGATGTWPQRGEVDIMEIGHVDGIAAGVVNRRVSAALHWSRDGRHATRVDHIDVPTDLLTGFRIYRLHWDPQTIRMSIDGMTYFEMDIANADDASLQAFHAPHHVLLNLAVGGSYTGIFEPDGVTASLPARMQVDYIRLYQDHPDSELQLGTDPESRESAPPRPSPPGA